MSNQEQAPGALGIMCRHLQMSLAELPWPLNILKFNQAVQALKPGEDMIARIDDADVVGNLQQLLNNRPDVRFDVVHTSNDYRIRVTKG